MEKANISKPEPQILQESRSAASGCGMLRLSVAHQLCGEGVLVDEVAKA